MSNVEGSLVVRTRELLQRDGRTYLEIYSETGFTPSWLSLFAQGKIANPSAHRVQSLYEFLSNKKLPV